jgi:peroxiredoxin
MTSPAIGDPAPNFDLTSTEDCLLMLRDEVARTAVLLYFFPILDDRARADLTALAARHGELLRRDTRVLAISRVKLADLKAVQRELRLPFPLLHDDRNFSAHYGVEAAAEGVEGAPALYVVASGERIAWAANPVAAVAEALPEVESLVKDLPPDTAGYPRSVINRLVDRWVHLRG